MGFATVGTLCRIERRAAPAAAVASQRELRDDEHRAVPHPRPPDSFCATRPRRCAGPRTLPAIYLTSSRPSCFLHSGEHQKAPADFADEPARPTRTRADVYPLDDGAHTELGVRLKPDIRRAGPAKAGHYVRGHYVPTRIWRSCDGSCSSRISTAGFKRVSSRCRGETFDSALSIDCLTPT